MVIPYAYAYFFGVLYLAVVWLFLYWRMPRHRKAMLFFGLSLSWLGIMAEHLWFLKEWWHPQTITGTRIGIEDFVASVTHLTVPALLYKYVFGRDSEGIGLDVRSRRLFLKNFGILFFFLMALFLALCFGSAWRGKTLSCPGFCPVCCLSAWSSSCISWEVSFRRGSLKRSGTKVFFLA
jgi:hypothetical protein